MKVSFNGVPLNDILEVVEGFSPFRGQSFSPMVTDSALDGGKFNFTKRGVKTLAMPFIIQKNLAPKYDRLMKILNVSEPKRLEFNAQKDRYFLAIPSGDLQITETPWQLKGTITWIIPDALGHARVSKQFPVNAGTKTITVTNEGTAPVSPSFLLTCKATSAYVGIASEYGAVQVGNDVGTTQTIVPSSRDLLDVRASDGTLQAQQTGGGSFTGRGTWKYDGTWQTGDHASRKWLAPASYGTTIGNWHGATKHGNLVDPVYNDGITNFTVDLRLGFVNSAPDQKGLMEFVLVDGNGNIMLGFAIDKGYTGNAVVLRLYNGETAANIDLDTGVNDYIDLAHGQVVIVKTGKLVEFRFANRTIRYYCNSLENTVFTSWNIISAQHASDPATLICWWERIKITKHYTETQVNIPDQFRNGDLIFFDGDKGLVYQNGVRIADTRGSKWFQLPPGDSDVMVVVPPGVTLPDAKAVIEEAYL